MKIAILSDIHDRLDHLEAALEKAKSMGCERLFYLGDFCAPFTLRALIDGFPGTINAVLGNNDGDPLFLGRVEAQSENLHLHGYFADFNVRDLRIALTHSPKIAKAVALSGQYNAVFFGHTHVAENTVLDNGTILANPGEIMGRFGKVTFGIYDTGLETFSLVPVYE